LTAFRTLLPFLRPYRWHMALVLASNLLVMITSLLAPWLISSIVGVVRVAPDQALSNGVLVIAAALAGAYALRGLGLYITFYVSHIAAWRVCHDLRLAVYTQLQRMSPRFFASRQTGELASRVLKDTDHVEPIVADVVHEFLASALITLGTVVVLLTLNPLLAVVGLLPAIPATWLVWRDRHRMMAAFDAEERSGGQLSGLIHDQIGGIREIQIFNREHLALERVRAVSHQLAHQQIGARRMMAALQPVVEGATGASIVLVVLLGGWLAQSGQITVETLVAFILYLIGFYQPLYMLVGVSEALQRGLAGLRRVDEMLQLEPDVADAPDGVVLGRANGAITFKGVSFSYRDDLPVLQRIDLQIDAGQTVALVGPTGAGKSTFAGLIPRFYDPQAGQMLLDGIDLRQIRLDTLRRNISMVTQDVFLFNGTVQENIRFGNPDASDAEVVAAAEAANAHEFIQHLPQGYATEIGERGVRLSGGQKQRLSIARAILKDAPILILDEATSAVDTETEHSIQEALNRLRQGRTCIVIAHRLSTIRSADLILVLDQGQVIQMGRHDQIVVDEGLYRRLYERQYALHG